LNRYTEDFLKSILINHFSQTKLYEIYQVVGKVVFFRLVKNIQMQGTRNPGECGVLFGTL